MAEETPQVISLKGFREATKGAVPASESTQWKDRDKTSRETMADAKVARAMAEVERTKAEVERTKAEVERALAEVEGRKKYHELRWNWATYLKWLVGLTALFQGCFVVLVGRGFLLFSGHETYLNTISAELFLQIIGLAYIVVRFLYPSETGNHSPVTSKEKSATPLTDDNST